MSAKVRKAGASLALVRFCLETLDYPWLWAFPLARVHSALQLHRGKFTRLKNPFSNEIFRAQEIFVSVHKRFKY